jgi:hypothetical protein
MRLARPCVFGRLCLVLRLTLRLGRCRRRPHGCRRADQAAERQPSRRGDRGNGRGNCRSLWSAARLGLRRHLDRGRRGIIASGTLVQLLPQLGVSAAGLAARTLSFLLTIIGWSGWPSTATARHGGHSPACLVLALRHVCPERRRLAAHRVAGSLRALVRFAPHGGDTRPLFPIGSATIAAALTIDLCDHREGEKVPPRVAAVKLQLEMVEFLLEARAVTPEHSGKVIDGHADRRGSSRSAGRDRFPASREPTPSGRSRPSR